MKDPKDQTKITLIYANVNPDDILLKEELDRLQAAHPHKFSVSDSFNSLFRFCFFFSSHVVFVVLLLGLLRPQQSS